MSLFLSTPSANIYHFPITTMLAFFAYDSNLVSYNEVWLDVCTGQGRIL